MVRPRLLFILAVAGLAACGRLEKPARHVTTRTSKPNCAAAKVSGAAFEIRLFVLGVGFDTSSGAFDKDEDVACKAFLTFLKDSQGYDDQNRALASLVTAEAMVPDSESLPELTVDGSKPCHFQGTSATVADVARRAPKDFSATHYLVLLGPKINKDLSGGCSDRIATMFLSSVNGVGVYSATIVHEMGHGIGGLDDEYTGPNAYPNGESYLSPNCSTDNSAFQNVTHTSGEPGCLGYGSGIYHPAKTCWMLNGGPFDAACAKQIRSRLTAYSSPVDPWSAATTATKGIEVTAILAGNSLAIVNAVDARHSTIRPQTITGNWFAVAYDGAPQNIVAVTPLAIRTNDAPLGRAYSGKPGDPEIPYEPKARLVRFTLVGFDKGSIKNRRLNLRLSPIPIGTSDVIVSNHVVQMLSRVGLGGKEYPLQAALEEFYLNRR